MEFKTSNPIRSGATAQIAYQLRCYLGDVNEKNFSQNDLFMFGSDIVFRHIRRQANGLLIPLDIRTYSIRSAETGKDYGCIYDSEKMLFTARYAYPDEKVPAARHILEVELRAVKDNVVLGVKLTDYGMPVSRYSCPKDTVPSFISVLRNDLKLNDGATMQVSPYKLYDDSISGFVSYLSSPDRVLPAVVVSEGRSAGVDGKGHLVDPKVLSEALKDRARVFVLPYGASYAFSRSVGDEWSCYNGAIRIYWADDIDWDLDDPQYYPVITEAKIEKLGYGREGVTDYIISQIMDEQSHYGMRWNDYGIEFYSIEQCKRNISSENYGADVTTCNTGNTGNLRNSGNSGCGGSYEAMMDSLEEYKSLAEEMSSCASKAQEDSASLQKQILLLNNYIAHQRSEIERISKNNNMPEDIVVVPNDITYKDIPGWVSENYPDRVYLTPRAIRSLKNAEYKDPSLVCRCLQLLAEEYYGFQRGTCTYDDFLNKMAEVDSALSESGSITNDHAGEEGENYFVQYGGRRRMLDRHICKGYTHDDRLCMRIYFFWDDASQMVVVGSLPAHLDNRYT